MKFGIFYEHQLPRPWADGAEEKLLHEALDQVQLASGVAFHVMRILQEAATNIVKHSQARHMVLIARVRRDEARAGTDGREERTEPRRSSRTRVR